MMTTFIEVRTLWTFHGDTMIHLQKIEWIFTLWKLLAEVAGIALLLGGALAQAPRYDLLLRAATSSILPTTLIQSWMFPSRKTKSLRAKRAFPAVQRGK